LILDDFKLDGKVAIVTGASRGLGRAIAEGLAEAGADVVLVATNAELLRDVAAGIGKLGRRTLVFPADLTDVAKLDELVSKTVETFGRIDILVNAAGTTARYPAEDFPAEEFDRVIAVNLRSVFLLTQRVGRVMIAQKSGKIIHIASMQSEVAGKNIVPYSASKGGIRQMTKALAQEWSRYGIHVNAIGPGYFRTDMTEPLHRDRKRCREILSRIPLGRWGRPDELKGIAVYLASSASDYVQGQIVYVDGGYLAG
jgi:2-deoxy-D-gluconate 3-dehydrogenase